MFNISFNFEEEPGSQIEAVEQIAIIKGWDASKKIAQLILCMPTDWRSVLRERALALCEGLVEKKDTEAMYGAYREAALEILWNNHYQTTSLSDLLNGKPQKGENLVKYYTKMKGLVRRIKPSWSPKDVEDLCLDNLLLLFPQQTRIVLLSQREKGLNEVSRLAQKIYEDQSKEDNCVGATTNRSQEKIDRLCTLMEQMLSSKESTNIANKRPVLSYKRDNLSCWECGKKGHIRRNCFKLKYTNSKRESVGATEQPVMVSVRDPELREEVRAMVDTGSAKSIIRTDKIKKFTNFNHHISLCSVNGKPLRVRGSKFMDVIIGSQTIKAEFIVVDGLIYDAIVGRDILSLGGFIVDVRNNQVLEAVTCGSCEPSGWEVNRSMINTTLSEKCLHEMLNLLKSYEDVFASSKYDIGLTTVGEHAIPTSSNHPVAKSCYRVPEALKAEAELTISKLLDNNIIQKSNSPWRSPVTMPRKKMCLGVFASTIDV